MHRFVYSVLLMKDRRTLCTLSDGCAAAVREVTKAARMCLLRYPV